MKRRPPTKAEFVFGEIMLLVQIVIILSIAGMWFWHLLT